MAKHNSCTHSLIVALCLKSLAENRGAFVNVWSKMGNGVKIHTSTNFHPYTCPADNLSLWLQRTAHRHWDRQRKNTRVFVRWILKRDEASAGNYKPRIPFISFHIWSIHCCSRHTSIICQQPCVCVCVCMSAWVCVCWTYPLCTAAATHSSPQWTPQ